jgi:hypothetical protein
VLSDVNQKPPEPAVARRLLNDSVTCDFDKVETISVKSGKVFTKYIMESNRYSPFLINVMFEKYRQYIGRGTYFRSLVREMEGHVFQGAISVGSRIYEALHRVYDIIFFLFRQDSCRKVYLSIPFRMSTGMLVITSKDENPMDSLSNMVQKLQHMLSMSPPKMMPKWFSSSILRYYILLHDASTGDKQKLVLDECF